MEKTFNREHIFSRTFLPALILVSMAFTMLVIMYGVDTIIPTVHDTFHDFRHVLGMPCH